MPYDTILATRIMAIIGPLPNLVEKKMFGGIGFLVNGNMACGVHKDEMIIRVGPQASEQALSRPHTRIFDMTGHPMVGWVMVAPEGIRTESQLKYWVDLGLSFTATLPPKEK